MTEQPVSKRTFIVTATAAVGCMVVLAIAGEMIAGAGATSYLYLEATASAQRMREIVDSWSAHGVAAIGNFAMGFDYLFMAAYATLFVLGARICLVATWTIPRRLRTVVAALPLVAIFTALLDALENALEMLVGYDLAPAPDTLASVALAVTIAKWIGVALCLPAALAALWAIVTRRY